MPIPTGDSGRLAGRTALVTGAETGVGAGIARALAEAGARVALHVLYDQLAVEGLVAEIQTAGGEALSVGADLGDEADVERMFDGVLASLGRLDILINNAGIRRDDPVRDLSLKDWEAVLRVNLTGQFLCAREAIRCFTQQGPPPAGAPSAGNIICISSVHDRISWTGHASYAASKGGVMRLMQTMAQELAPYRIRVNGISPGAIRTEENRAVWESPAAEAALLERIPYGRLGTTGEVGRAAVWLASDESEYMTGATLYVDGGMTLCPGLREGG